MNEDEEKLSVYDDVCRVIGRAVVILKEAGQPVTQDRIKLMLQVHSELNDDAYMSKIYATAQDVLTWN
ncbi:DUF2767 family protein [Salmonella enterica subsp. enterica]|nr:DUF2767 family protein [Salmonella enterica]ECC3607255.1 DUF2767 family protein [Salmonella enterica subsp. enterica]EGI6197714.1 DUF2767 family protein [Salmonella enterica subsp. enterica serovar Eastbourne]ECE0940223.1 DUF2767 family protein [Salmonella enterica subsp. enterica]ECH9416588.1 DUF2767 family protein [Salmonella enterica subsp. enterica]